MRHFVSLLALPLLICAAPQSKPAAKKPLTGAEIIAASPPSAWVTIDPENLMVMDLAKGGRIVVQLAPEFAPAHVANIRALARASWWKGASVYRVQDNFVAQWGHDEKGPPLPSGVMKPPPKEYWRSTKGLAIGPLGFVDAYAPAVGYAGGWPIAYSPKGGWATLPHCYGYVGVARDLAPDTGTGEELYAIIGHAPRRLDRNLAVVGRVIEGIDRLSSLPRGPAPMGMYGDASRNVGIASVRLVSEMPASDRPSFQMMNTSSATFGQILQLRTNHADAFYQTPPTGIDICGSGVPVRKTPPA
ncbi:MAG: peptidylprolyl isomerase [Sphingomicrobium sp.]